MLDRTRLYPGLRTLSPERTMEDLRNLNRGRAVADGQTAAALKAIGN